MYALSEETCSNSTLIFNKYLDVKIAFWFSSGREDWWQQNEASIMHLDLAFTFWTWRMFSWLYNTVSGISSLPSADAICWCVQNIWIVF